MGKTNEGIVMALKCITARRGELSTKEKEKRNLIREIRSIENQDLMYVEDQHQTGTVSVWRREGEERHGLSNTAVVSEVKR